LLLKSKFLYFSPLDLFMRETLVQALHAGGATLLSYFGKIRSVKTKENQSSIVTKADIASEKRILSIIKKKFPAHNTIAEESGYTSRGSRYTWIIDPLDGTSNFASGIPWFCVLIAVTKDDVPILGGMYLPCDDLLYIAEKGKGATRNGKRISVTKEKELKNVLFSYGIDFSADVRKTDRELKIIKTLVQHTRNLRATNSATDDCYTADGRMGGRICQTAKIWDNAAPYVIITEAGGKITDIDGKPMSFSATEKDYLRNFTSVSSTKVLHPKIMKLIRKN
jgi:myo-inositol-1(or 4)-monophosphatase